MNLIPTPHFLRRSPGRCLLPDSVSIQFGALPSEEEPVSHPAYRLKSALEKAGVAAVETNPLSKSTAGFRIFIRHQSSFKKPGSYRLTIQKNSIELAHGDVEGMRNAVATLRQLLGEFGRNPPRLVIHDFPVFARRGVMLDVSRGRVPKLETLLDLADKLADFKINEFQLYLEHTFAYSGYEEIWRDWDPITPDEIVRLDAACRKLGIDLVPNQNSFGHLRHWLEHPSLKKLGEIDRPVLSPDGTFARRPATLAPNHPGTLPFIRGLYDELLPHFSGKRFNVGCDETFDLGLGQSKELCEKRGKVRVYLDFVKKIHAEVKSRGLQMMFWGDIILHHPELVREVPKNAIALNWGYETGHPFDKETALFKKSGVPFYVCPGTSTWQTLVGRHDNALKNLQEAADAGKRNSAIGYLNTDWGDGGHAQPPAVSWLAYLAGADAAWSGNVPKKSVLVKVLNRDIFKDPSGESGRAALGLGLAHRKTKYFAFNATPLGATLGAPPPAELEIFCRDGLKYFARIRRRDIVAALVEVRLHLRALEKAAPQDHASRAMVEDLAVAGSLAAESCEFMLWQQDLDEGKTASAKARARRGIRVLGELKARWKKSWAVGNKGTPGKHWPFLDWRIRDYQRGSLPVSRENALKQPKVSAH